MDFAAVSELLISNGAAVNADVVCVTNSAGFVMGYFFNDLVTGDEGREGDAYPIDQTKCAKITDNLSSVNQGDLVLLEVHAHLGETLAADTALVYTPGAATVTFTCTGTTLDFACKMNGLSEFTDDELSAYIEMFQGLQ